MGNFNNSRNSYAKPLERRAVTAREVEKTELSSKRYSLAPRVFPFSRRPSESTDDVIEPNKHGSRLANGRSMISQSLLGNLKIFCIANGIAGAIPEQLSILNNLNLLSSMNSFEDEGFDMHNYLDIYPYTYPYPNTYASSPILKKIDDCKLKSNRIERIEQFIKEESEHTSKAYKNYLVNDRVVSRTDKNKNLMKNILIVKREKIDSEGKSTSPNSNQDSNMAITKSLKSIKLDLRNLRKDNNNNTQLKNNKNTSYTSQSPCNTKRSKNELLSKSPSKPCVTAKANPRSLSKTKVKAQVPQSTKQIPKKTELKTIVYKPTINNPKERGEHSPRYQVNVNANKITYSELIRKNEVKHFQNSQESSSQGERNRNIPKDEIEYKNINININELNIINKEKNKLENPSSMSRNTPVFNSIAQGAGHNHGRSNSFGCHFMEFNPNIVGSNMSELDESDAKFSFKKKEAEEERMKKKK